MGWLDDLLSGGSGALLGAGAAGAAYKDISNRLGDIGTKSREGALAVGEQARADTQFQPFTVSTGFGGLPAPADGSICYCTISCYGCTTTAATGSLWWSY